MRNLWILFKTNIVNTFSLNLLKKKFSKRSSFLRIWVPIITVFLALAVFAFIIFYMYSISSLFYMVGKLEGIIYFGSSFGALLCLISTISKANSYLFQSKDYDLLMSLPISSRTVITSKLLSLLFLNYISFAFVFLPSVFWYAYFATPDFIFYILAFILFILGPLLVVTICSGVSYLFGLILSRLKHRNFIQTIGMLIFFLGVMFLSFSFNNINSAIGGNEEQVLIELVDRIIGFAKAIYYPSVFFVDGLINNDLLSLAIYVLISIIPFVLFIYIVGHNFVKANARARITYTDKNFKLGEQKIKGQLKSLFGKELKIYFSNASVVLNTIVGPIMGTILVVLYCFSPQVVMGNVEGLDITDYLAPMAIALTTFMNGIISTTSSSVSLEGKQFWIIKSLPLKEETIFLSKILLNIIIALPFTIINVVVISIFGEPLIIEIIAIILLPLLVSTFMAVIGLYLNIVFPKFNWTSPVKVVKQSLSTGLSMLVGFILMIGLVVLYINILSFGYSISYIIIIFILLVLIGIFTLVLLTDGKRRFKRLNN